MAYHLVYVQLLLRVLAIIGISLQLYEVSIFASIVIGAVLGFLMFNIHPAKVFYGRYRVSDAREALYQD